MASKEQLATVFKMWVDFEEMKVNPYKYVLSLMEQFNKNDMQSLLDKADKLSDKEMIHLAGVIKGRKEFMIQVELILSELKSKKEAEEELE